MTAPESTAGGGLGGLLHNRHAQIAAAAVLGLAGLYAYWKNKQNGAASSTSATGTTGVPGAPAADNTIGTDVAAQLGQFNAEQTAAFNQFAQELQGLIPPTGGTGTTPPVMTPPHIGPITPGNPTPVSVGRVYLPAPAPAAPAAAPAPATVTNTASYIDATQWPSQLGSLGGIAAYEHESLAQVEALNPQIKNPSLIFPGEAIRVR